MATVSTSIQYTLEQRIVPTILESLSALDPIYPMLRRSSTGVVRNRGIGRGWQVLRTWGTGMAGGAKFVAMGGSDVLSGPAQATVYSTPSSFQSVDETTAPAFLQTTLNLIEHKGNFFLPREIIRADRLNASIGSVVALNLKGVADLLAQQESSVFFSNDTTSYSLLSLGTVASTCSVSGSVLTVDLSHASIGVGRIHRFRQGMLVDIWNSGGTTQKNSDHFLLVDNVDPIGGTVALRRLDGASFPAVGTYLANNDIVTIKDSKGVAPNSLDSWIADGSTVTSWFGLTVNSSTNSQFRSLLDASTTTPTETALNTNYGKFYEAFPGKVLPTALTTVGVLLAFIDNLDAANTLRYERQGKAMDIVAGWEGLKYRFAGKPCDIYTSVLLAPGHWIAGKMDNGGITRYVPPTLPGSRMDRRFGEEVEFIASLGGDPGYQGIFKHAHSSTGATSNFVEAPFVRHWNCMPTQPNFLKMSTLTDSISM